MRPYVYGGPGVATFTRRYGRWLSASVSAVSPDSSHYAYAESYNDPNGPRSRIHVVDLASAADRVVYDQGFFGGSATSPMAFTYLPLALRTRQIGVCGGSTRELGR